MRASDVSPGGLVRSAPDEDCAVVDMIGVKCNRTDRANAENFARRSLLLGDVLQCLRAAGEMARFFAQEKLSFHGRGHMGRIAIALLIGLAWLAPTASARLLDAPIAHAAATCADYPNQAAAQRAADTRDADGDGIYCESLPCPCLKPGEGGGGADPAPTP